MKRILSMLMILVLLCGTLISCSSELAAEGQTATATETATEEEEKTKEKRDPTGFCAGFSSAVINPVTPTGMGGYGNASTRLSTTVARDIIISCTCVSDGKQKALFFSVDVCGVGVTNANTIRKQVKKELGIDPEYVVVTATHSHSAPAINSDDASLMPYLRTFYPTALRVAKEAVADLDRCEMKFGRTATENLSYVRRYFRESGEFTGVNYLSTSKSPIVRHETELDPEMLLLKFDRVNGKDIVLMNWACHVTTAGGTESTVISSDWVGALRDEVLEKADVLLSFHQAGAGNVVPNSSIESEPDNDDYNKHGKDIAKVVIEALPKLEAVPAGEIRAVQKDVFCTYEKDMTGYNLEEAKEIQVLYKAREMDQARTLCLQYGYHSVYHANSIANRPNRSADGINLGISAIRIGEIGIAVAPYEMFDTNAKEVKDNSPLEKTMVFAYSNGAHGYIPSSIAWPNGGYEVDTCAFTMGTGEMLAQELVALIDQIK